MKKTNIILLDKKYNGNSALAKLKFYNLYMNFIIDNDYNFNLMRCGGFFSTADKTSKFDTITCSLTLNRTNMGRIPRNSYEKIYLIKNEENRKDLFDGFLAFMEKIEDIKYFW